MGTEADTAGLTLGFYGHASAGLSDRARRFEDEVLALLPAYGAKVVFRGHRKAGESDDLPAEFHVLWFPSDEALDSYLHDPRRSEILVRYGDVFSRKVVVRLDPIEA
jgi:uncharacterized protein (DUF1330 family)